MTYDNNFREKLHHSLFNNPVQKSITKPSISKVDRFLGKKGARKFLGRNRSSRGKIKSKRKNNYKTLNARKILQSRHGIANALKKIENKYLLTYGDIAKLMRKFHYIYNRDLRKWVQKAPKDTKKHEEPVVKKDKEPENKEKSSDDSSHGKDEKNKPEEKPDGKEKENKPFVFTPPEKKEPKKEHKDRLKSTQGRVILISMGQEDCAEYTIVPDSIEYKVSDIDVLARCSQKELLWLKKRDKFTDYKGKDPNLLEGYRGTLGRAILIDKKFYSFLSFEEENLDMVNEKMEELGYEYHDGTWVDMEEKPSEEPVKEEVNPDSPDYFYNQSRKENGDCKECGEPLTRVRGIGISHECYNGHAWLGDKRTPQYDRDYQKKLAAELNEAGGTSSTPAVGTGQNSQGIARYNAPIDGIKRRKFL